MLPSDLKNMVEGPDVWMTSQLCDQLMWQWWRWVLAEEADMVASKVSIFPAFSVLVFTPQTGQSWKAGKDGGYKSKNMQKQKGARDGERTGQWCWWLSQILNSAQNSARSHHVKAKLAEWTGTTPGPATLYLLQSSTAVSWTNADAK